MGGLLMYRIHCNWTFSPPSFAPSFSCFFGLQSRSPGRGGNASTPRHDRNPQPSRTTCTACISRFRGGMSRGLGLLQVAAGLEEDDESHRLCVFQPATKHRASQLPTLGETHPSVPFRPEAFARPEPSPARCAWPFASAPQLRLGAVG